MEDKNRRLEIPAIQAEADEAKGSRYKLTADMPAVTADNLWEMIVSRQGETFYTKKGLPFTYTVKGGELFADRREKSITRSTFEKAYLKYEQSPEQVVGPKTLNVFGAPYVWAVLVGLGVIR